MTKSTLDGQVTTDWDERFAERTHSMVSSIIRDLLKLALQPDIISFAGGMPASELFLAKEFEEACRDVLIHDAARALQYGTTEGYPPLRQYLVQKMQEYDVPAEPENILLVNGSQQALDLIGKMFINPGDVVLTEGAHLPGSATVLQSLPGALRDRSPRRRWNPDGQTGRGAGTPAR